MASYEARRDKEEEKQRADENNARNIRNAADVAIASKEGHAVVIGGAVKAADKLTGGKSTELLGKGLTSANKFTPGGKQLQDVSNKLSESGASDKIGKAASMYNNVKGNAGGDTPNQVKNDNTNGVGGEQNSSLPTSGSKQNQVPPNVSQASSGAPQEEVPKNSNNNIDEVKKDDKDSDKNNGFGNFNVSLPMKIAIAVVVPSLIFILFLVSTIGMVAGLFSDYEDAFGISDATGEETGGVLFSASTKDQQKFYDRVNDVKNSYQSNGKNVDPLKVVAVYHILDINGANVTYKKMTKSKIKKIADCMFDENNTYSEEVFKDNLINSLFPKYLPKSTDLEREQMANDVIDYIDRYYNLIGKDTSSSCSSGGSCQYDIKGFYIQGKGNVTKNMQVSDLYVRLMQCGTANGHNYGGTFGQPMPGEDLVPFEKYVLGAAYQEIGPSSPEAAIKAQLVATRGYALARPFDMGGWRTLKQESDGKWVLQVASCTQDQVYCDPDKGCSGTNGQWGQIHSGLSYNKGFSRGPMAEDHPMRTYASEVEGEVLINSTGNIIYTGFTSVDQNKFISLAKSGLNYKQILLQVYNQGNRNYGATDISKAGCGGSSINCSSSTGEYASWKQFRGSWTEVKIGTSGRTIHQIGCLATSVSIQIARSGVSTNIQGEFNPGTFVEYLNGHGGFDGGNFIWAGATAAAPDFKYQDRIYMSGWSRQQKLNKIKELTSQKGVYAVAEVKGNTGQHWVAIDSVNGDNVTMMDPGSDSTDLWSEYNWANTSQLVYYKVG